MRREPHARFCERPEEKLLRPTHHHLHWVLDVVFHEDDAHTRKNHAPGNLAVIRRMALDMLRAHPDKRSIARKMKMAVWSKAFFQELFSYVR